MTDIERQIFSIPTEYKTYLLVCMGAAGLVVSGLLVLTAIEGRSDGLTMGMAMLVLCILSAVVAASIYLFCHYRSLDRYTVEADGDGLWMSVTSKNEGLVRWEQIIDLHESRFGQRVILLGDSGAELMRIEFQLLGFVDLLSLVVEHAHLAPKESTYPLRVSTSIFSYFGTIASIGFLAVLGMIVAQGHIIFGLGFIVFITCAAAYEKQNWLLRLDMDEQTVRLQYPFRKEQYSRHQIDGLYLGIESYQNLSKIVTCVCVRGRQLPLPIAITGFSFLQLYVMLKKWQESQDVCEVL